MTYGHFLIKVLSTLGGPLGTRLTSATGGRLPAVDKRRISDQNEDCGGRRYPAAAPAPPAGFVAAFD